MSVILAGMTIVFVSLVWALPTAAAALAWFAVWGALAWSTQTPQQHRLLSLHPDKGSVAVALQSFAHYAGSAAGAAVGGLALGAGVPLTRLPLVVGIVLAAAFIGQIVISFWNPLSERNRAGLDPSRSSTAGEAVAAEPP